MIEDEVVKGKLLVGKTSLFMRIVTKQGFVLSTSLSFLPELRTVGVSNITEDFRFIFFGDFDSFRLNDLFEHLKELAHKYDISHFLVLESSPNNYHCISFERFELNELRNILRDSMVDYTHRIDAIKLDKGYILRLAPKYDLDGKIIKDKPTLIDFYVFSFLSKRMLSRAHVELFTRLYGLNQNPSFVSFMNNNEYKFDDYEKVKLVYYGTSNRSLLKNLDLGDLLKSRRLSIEWIKGGDIDGQEEA